MTLSCKNTGGSADPPVFFFKVCPVSCCGKKLVLHFLRFFQLDFFGHSPLCLQQADDPVIGLCGFLCMAEDLPAIGDPHQLILKSRPAVRLFKGLLVIIDGFLIVTLFRVILCCFEKTGAVIRIAVGELFHDPVRCRLVEARQSDICTIDLDHNGI